MMMKTYGKRNASASTEAVKGSFKRPRPAASACDDLFRSALLGDPCTRQLEFLDTLTYPNHSEAKTAGICIDDVMNDEIACEAGASAPPLSRSPLRNLIRADKMLPPLTPAAAIIKSLPPSPTDIRGMRQQNLHVLSSSSLLLLALQRKHHPQLQALLSTMMAGYSDHGQDDDTACVSSPSRRSYPMLARRSLRVSTPPGKEFISEMDPDLERLIDALLRQGADPAHSGADGATALSLAIQYRNADSVVDKLLDHGAVAQQIVHERSLVDIALHLSQAHMVEQLLLRGGLPTVQGALDPDDQSFCRVRLLHFAKAHRFYPVAARALTNAFWAAVDEPNEATLDAMLMHGIPVNMTDREGLTALHRAIRDKASLAFMQYLLRKGADPNILDKRRNPMCATLLLRSSRDSVKAIALLCDYKLDVTAMVPDTQQSLLEFARSSAILPETVAVLEQYAGSCSGGRTVSPRRNSTNTASQDSARLSCLSDNGSSPCPLSDDAGAASMDHDSNEDDDS